MTVKGSPATTWSCSGGLLASVTEVTSKLRAAVAVICTIGSRLWALNGSMIAPSAFCTHLTRLESQAFGSVAENLTVIDSPLRSPYFTGWVVIAVSRPAENDSVHPPRGAVTEPGTTVNPVGATSVKWSSAEITVEVFCTRTE